MSSEENVHEENLVVFISVHKLAGIDAPVSIICRFYYFVR